MIDHFLATTSFMADFTSLVILSPTFGRSPFLVRHLAHHWPLLSARLTAPYFRHSTPLSNINRCTLVCISPCRSEQRVMGGLHGDSGFVISRTTSGCKRADYSCHLSSVVFEKLFVIVVHLIRQTSRSGYQWTTTVSSGKAVDAWALQDLD